VAGRRGLRRHRHLPRQAGEARQVPREGDLKVTLLADPDKKVLDAYGAFGEKKNYGKTYMGVIRSTIIVDEAGKSNTRCTTSGRRATWRRSSRTWGSRALGLWGSGL